MKKIGIVYHPDYLLHDTGNHPENAERLNAIMNHLKRESILEKCTLIEPDPADEEDILRVHSEAHFNTVKEACEEGMQALDMDTIICPYSFRAAMLAVGGITDAADEIMDKNIDRAFAAVRPPGHHATADRAMGFCLFNNVAIGTRYVQKKYGIEKVLIVDWDLHHGNGTQDIFYSDASVLYFSIHQKHIYPGTGWEKETGSGSGIGFTLNVPVSGGIDPRDYFNTFKESLYGKATEFQPGFVFISAGFDCHQADPLGGLTVTEREINDMTKVVVDIAEKTANGRIISCLEGGYNLPALAQSVETHILTMMEADKA